ncbi:hypothetical protein SAMN05216282_12521 [Cryobacterium psychrotolerans]|uniref:Uncharacterized protein n=1 Tax=Cryobacterium psychrotolerans TaxID=386301 RepID=A0A1G9H0D5_9MICO|nr:hypothetical protein SAMN05216282_12521 [Cryobacterium psychrotolerans]
MSALTNYGRASAATPMAIQKLLSSPSLNLQVTARTPHATRVGVTGPSMNLFLYSDGLMGLPRVQLTQGVSGFRRP